jgi:hypothetical protein
MQKEMDTIKHRTDDGVFDDALLLEDRADSGPAAAAGVRANARGALRSPGARLRQSHLRESTGLGAVTGAAACTLFVVCNTSKDNYNASCDKILARCSFWASQRDRDGSPSDRDADERSTAETDSAQLSSASID